MSCSLSRSSSGRRSRWPGFESSLAPLPSRGGERGRRGGRGGSLGPPLALFVAVVDSGSVLRAMLVSLVTFLFVLCSLRFLAGS